LPWSGEITCGHNPYLRARLVDDLTVERHEDGKEEVKWKERPKTEPKVLNMNALRVETP